MKLTYFLWGYPYDESIIRAFLLQGFVIERVELLNKLKKSTGWEELMDQMLQKDEEEEQEGIINRLKNCSGDIFFSVNFNSAISDFCRQEGIPYCSWVLQLPNYDLYTEAVFNECNYIGICDSYLVEKMWAMDVKKVFFLPDAIELGEKAEDWYTEREFCFIGKQPANALQREGMSLYAKGYLDSFLQAQRVLYGSSVLENGLPKRVYQEVLSCNMIPNCILPQLHRLYVADRYLASACTVMQQNIFMKNNEKMVTIYSDNSFDMCVSPKHPYVFDEKERWKIYNQKEFSLVLTPYVLHNAIPRDTLEVIAAGGFPICGYQKDYSYFFKKDEDLVYFTNNTEFHQAVVRYGNHPEERIRVKENAYRVVSEGHTYSQRVANMLEMWGRL